MCSCKSAEVPGAHEPLNVVKEHASMTMNVPLKAPMVHAAASVLVHISTVTAQTTTCLQCHEINCTPDTMYLKAD